MSCDTLTFYNQAWCPKSQSVQLALEASNTPHSVVEVGSNQALHACKEHSDIPILVKNGETSVSSYQEAASYLNLMSVDPDVKSKQEKFLTDFFKFIIPHFERAVILESPREGMDLFIEALSYLENELVYAGGKFFGGENPNVVDYGLFPYLDKVGKWTNTLEAKECPRTQTWINAMREHPLVIKVLRGKIDEFDLKNYSASLLTNSQNC